MLLLLFLELGVWLHQQWLGITCESSDQQQNNKQESRTMLMPQWLGQQSLGDKEAW